MRRAGGGAPLRVAVVGGGITGLSAAHRLQQLAAERNLSCLITVLERDGRLGGKVRTERAPGLLMEAGPDSFLTRKPWMVRLCHDMGLQDSLVDMGRPGATATYLWAGGKLHGFPAGSFLGIPGDAKSLLASGVVSWRGWLRFLAEPLVPPRPDGEEESLASFARRRLGREVATRLVEPLLAGIFGGDAEALSVDAAYPQLKEMELRYGSLRAGVEALMKNGAQPGRKQGGGAPAPFQTLRTGLESVVETLVARLTAAGVTVRAGVGVRELVAPQGTCSAGAPVARGPLVLRLDNREEAAFDRVILTTPAWAAASILERSAPEAAAQLRTIPYRSAASVYLAYRRASVPHPLDGTGYITAREEERAVTATTWVSSKWPHSVADRDRVLIRCHMGPYRGTDPARRDEEELVRDAREELARVLGVREEPELVRVFRWPAALPQYGPGHRQRLLAAEKALSHLPGVLLAGAAYHGVGLPDCVRQGQEAAERVIESASSGS